MADAEVGDVHAAAATLAVTGFLAEEFGDGAEDVILHDRFAQLLAGEGGEFRAAGVQLLFTHVLDRVESLGDRVAVAAVGAGDEVGDRQF